MIKDNHIGFKKRRWIFTPGCSEHDRGSGRAVFEFHPLCGRDQKRRYPCASCLRIAERIAADAAALTEDKE